MDSYNRIQGHFRIGCGLSYLLCVSIMVRRSRGREVVLQLLYQSDQNPGFANDDALQFLKRRLQNLELEGWAGDLYWGTLKHRKEIDQMLTEVAENWSVSRMAVVDRNILRLAAFELLHQTETPSKVVIDEAVELAKRYGSVDSSAFVNGILDRLALKRPGAEPPPPVADSPL